jgi:Amidohydrolase family
VGPWRNGRARLGRSDGEKENNNLDLLEEMKVASLIQKLVGLRAAAGNAWDVLAMATIEGARCLGLERLTGRSSRARPPTSSPWTCAAYTPRPSSPNELRLRSAVPERRHGQQDDPANSQQRPDVRAVALNRELTGDLLEEAVHVLPRSARVHRSDNVGGVEDGVLDGDGFATGLHDHLGTKAP